MSRVTLEQIEVDQPCQVPWEQMQGDDVRRFCQHCQKHVYDLSAMTRDRAERPICENAGNLCAQFQRTRQGQIVTLDYEPIKPKPPRGFSLFTILGWLGLSSVGAAMVAPAFTTRGAVRRVPPRQTIPYAPSYSPPRLGSQPSSPADDFNLQSDAMTDDTPRNK